MALAWIAAKTPLRVVQAMPQGAATSSVSEWMAARAVRLETPQYGHGFADMQPLKKIVGNARIVSLGEATHGTREFFQLKHRMLEFLASEMGFTIFSIEANMPEAYRLNDYVLTGRGDPARLLKGMYFWTWNTQEVLDMILWMREFNKSGKGRVEFTGFDMQTPTVALEIVRDFAIKADPEYAAAFRQASAQARDATSKGSAFGGATASFPVKPAAGKRARFSGYIKTERVTNGYAGLWWRVDGASGVLAFANLENRAPVGTTDWKRYELEIPIAADARNINFGALLSGNGTAWFDSLAVELDGVPYKDESVFDFDFESPSLKGFFSYGDGYRVRLDSDVVQSGKQSLQVKHVPAPQGESKPVDAAAAASTWKEVVRHFETSREAYRKKDLTAQEIEWAIQNARVVLQCLQMKANEVSRDRSMADNVKWILDRSPDAKIVLWAHNGHVSTAGYPHGRIATENVWRADGGVRVCLQPRLVPGDPPREGTDGFHRSAGAARQPRRDARGDRNPRAGARPEAGAGKRACCRVAERAPQSPQYRSRLFRRQPVRIHSGPDGAQVFRRAALRRKDNGGPQERGADSLTV